MARGVELSDGVVDLREPDHGDVAALVEAVRDSREHLWPWLAWATGDYGRAEATGFIEALGGGQAHAFLIGAGPGRLLGVCGLDVEVPDRTAGLGYWLRPGATGRGVATRAARLVLVHGLRELGLQRIEILMSTANAASRRVAERLDLDYEGVRRRALRIGDEQHDAHVFAAFVDDLGRLREDLDLPAGS